MATFDSSLWETNIIQDLSEFDEQLMTNCKEMNYAFVSLRRKSIESNIIILLHTIPYYRSFCNTM